MFEKIESHRPIWDQMQRLLLKNSLPHAFLYIGPRHTNIMQFVKRWVATLNCENENKPCGTCRACHLLKEEIHPDVSYIRPETLGSAIKVEQIRQLQSDIYQTPQLAKRRFIVIDPADKMNIAAANALLKILEEPPLHTVFMLIAEQLNSIPATILSRCQKYIFQANDEGPVDYLSLGQKYPAETPRAELFKQSATISNELCAVIEEKLSPCAIAAKWSEYAFDDLLWLLYLLTAQAIYQQLIEAKTNTLLSRLTSPTVLMQQIDQINALVRKLNHNINMNQTLMLENLLLGYVGQ